MAYDNMIRELQMAIPILMAEHDVPGLSIAIVDHDETVWSEGFGVTEQNKRQRVTKKTVFSVQSISKTYTAFGFLIATDRGCISLDDTVKTYLPRFRVKSRDDVDYSSHITFRHLLSCRSGLPPEHLWGTTIAIATSRTISRAF